MNIKKARDLVYTRSNRVCERCGTRRGTNWHHRRAAGRLWTPENGLDLCGSGTTGCHGWVTDQPILAKDYGWSVSNFHGDLLATPVLVYRRWVYLTHDGQKVPVPDPRALPPVARAFPDAARPPRS